jgi:hypothetical protein
VFVLQFVMVLERSSLPLIVVCRVWNVWNIDSIDAHLIALFRMKLKRLALTSY